MPALALLLALAAAAADPATLAEANTQAAIDRVKRIDPQIRAVLALDPTALDQAWALDRSRAARGPLFGLPILIKDNIETKGPLPTTAGSLALAANVTGRDAPLVARLRAAGAVILGKTNLSEWANMRSSASISGWSAIGGQTRNPFALDLRPVRLVVGQRCCSRRRADRGRNRLRDRRLDHLPRLAQRHRRVEADGRAGQPNAYRADQPQPGHRRPDGQGRPHRRAAARRDRGQRPCRSRHGGGGRAQGRLSRRAPSMR